jgi:pimeloyl-ACP methyl ester carboxylesterase
VGDGPELKFADSGGVPIAVWEWPGEDPPLVFAHATGFHGRSWDRIARAFPGRRRLALEFRGHGRSGKPAPPYPWPPFGRDVIAVAEQLDVRGAAGVGHSMGGHALIAAAAAKPEIFAALLLLDPVVLPPGRYGGPPLDASFILRRRSHWSSPRQMFERFHGRPPFGGWHPDVLRDYCEFGLLAENGAFTLACPPAVEASIYEHTTAPESNLHAEIPGVAQPVTVIRAGLKPRPGVFDPAASPTWPELAAAFPRGRDILLAGRNHYIPMECPELVAEEIARLD